METHDAVIYHCHTCGRVVHAEPEAEAPQCCGQAMVRSCEETPHEGDVAPEKGGSTTEAPPANEDRKKPR